MRHIHESFIDLYWTLADVILLKTFTLFTIPEFAVGLFCHWSILPLVSHSLFCWSSVLFVASLWLSCHCFKTRLFVEIYH